MTADERIERLVNRFGQTISDLPKPDNYKDYGNRDKLVNAMLSAERAYEEWYNPEDNSDWRDACNAYICHLCDIIDRMETALETASKVADCRCCEHDESYGSGECDYVRCYFQINDIWFGEVDDDGD